MAHNLSFYLEAHGENWYNLPEHALDLCIGAIKSVEYWWISYLYINILLLEKQGH